MLDRDAQTTLNDLRFHWDDFYRVSCHDGVWQASPLSDPAVIISRDTSMELREALRLDYTERKSGRWAGSSST